jgi:hypothetical protein
VNYGEGVFRVRMFLGEIFVWEGYITILFLEEGEYVVVVI